MLPARPPRHARIATVLAVVVLLHGCAQRSIVFPEQDQSSAQLAKDQAECVAEAKRSADYTGEVGKGFGTTLAGSIVGAVVGAGLGALLAVGIAANGSTEDPEKAGLIIAGGAGLGAVIGWFVGTGVGVKMSFRQAQDRVDQAFQRCMEQRGYKIGREHAEHA